MQAEKACYIFRFALVTYKTVDFQRFLAVCFRVTLYFKSIMDKIWNFKIYRRVQKNM